MPHQLFTEHDWLLPLPGTAAARPARAQAQCGMGPSLAGGHWPRALWAGTGYHCTACATSVAAALPSTHCPLPKSPEARAHCNQRAAGFLAALEAPASTVPRHCPCTHRHRLQVPSRYPRKITSSSTLPCIAPRSPISFSSLAICPRSTNFSAEPTFMRCWPSWLGSPGLVLAGGEQGSPTRASTSRVASSLACRIPTTTSLFAPGPVGAMPAETASSPHICRLFTTRLSSGCHLDFVLSASSGLPCPSVHAMRQAGPGQPARLSLFRQSGPVACALMIPARGEGEGGATIPSFRGRTADGRATARPTARIIIPLQALVADGRPAVSPTFRLITGAFCKTGGPRSALAVTCRSRGPMAWLDSMASMASMASVVRVAPILPHRMACPPVILAMWANDGQCWTNESRTE